VFCLIVTISSVSFIMMDVGTVMELQWAGREKGTKNLMKKHTSLYLTYVGGITWPHSWPLMGLIIPACGKLVESLCKACGKLKNGRRLLRGSRVLFLC
jgi:hypothetical protein